VLRIIRANLCRDFIEWSFNPLVPNGVAARANKVAHSGADKRARDAAQVAFTLNGFHHLNNLELSWLRSYILFIGHWHHHSPEAAQSNQHTLTWPPNQ
jgi:hypothetical protein